METSTPAPMLLGASNAMVPDEMMAASTTTATDANTTASHVESEFSNGGGHDIASADEGQSATTNSSESTKVPDLRNSKTELFNKLTTSQSQQMIVTTPNTTSINSSESENLNSATTLTTSQQQQVYSQHHQTSAATTTVTSVSTSSSSTDQQQQQQQQQQQKQQQLLQQFLPDDFKRSAASDSLSTPIFARSRSRWYTNEEVASILTSFSSHPEWQTNELQVRPKSGAVLLYSREKVRYRQDGYCWKKRKNGRTTREDHMKLKVQGIECIYGCYVHSAILPTFHRRCYWLLQNPDIVLVHYLNQPPDDQNKMMITFNSSLLEADTRRSWTNEEIIEEIGSVFGGISQIQHTLNINFPPSTAIIQHNHHHLQQQHHHQPQQQQQQHQQRQQQHLNLQQQQSDRMIESSPQSEQSLASTSSEAMNEQVEMAILDQQQPSHHHHHQQQQLVAEASGGVVAADDNAISSGREQDDYDDDDGQADDNVSSDVNGADNGEQQDELMTSLSQESNSLQTTSANNINTINNCDGQEVGQQHEEATSMSYDTILASNCGQPTDSEGEAQVQLDCYGYTGQSARMNVVNLDVIDQSRQHQHSDNRISSSSQAATIGQQQHQQMDQNPCSPVTQIYNKIVDDIETYALPLEPNQFDASHHHHHPGLSLPMQTMDIGNESDRQQHQLHQHQQQSQHLSQHHQQQQQHLHHHQSQHQHHRQQQQARLEQQQRFVDSQQMADKVACSMDLGSCDLFCGEPSNQNGGGGGVVGVGLIEESQQGVNSGAQGSAGGGTADDDNLLLSDFNLQAGSVGQVMNDELSSNVVDSFTNVDDLRELILGISSNDNIDNGNLLVDTNTLDLFNFKSAADCDLSSASPTQQHQHQLEVTKSASSDVATDSLSRLSPLLPSNPQVPRCNSTGTPTSSTTSNAHQASCSLQRQQELSSQHFLACSQPVASFTNGHHGKQQPSNNGGSSQRSSSTNPPSSSCSPSPSSSSLRTGISALSDRSNCLLAGDNTSQFTNSSAQTSSSSFIKLPLQQRQKSEQQEPSNSVLSSLLPKALSLDGSDLSASNHLRLSSSPLISAYDDSQQHHQQQQQQQSMLLIPSPQPQQIVGQSSSQQQQQQHCSLRTPCSPSIPLDSSSEILVVGGGGLDNFQHGSAAYPMLVQQQQQLLDSSGQHGHHHHQHQLLECKRHSSSSASSGGQLLLPILDYVPNWCNITGGAKVLIVGNWGSLLQPISHSNNNNLEQHLQNKLEVQVKSEKDCPQATATGHASSAGAFSAIFDDLLVPATLIQDNVLRCYVPSHEQGFITLKVLYMNRIVSEQVLFEMRPSCVQSTGGQQDSSAFHRNYGHQNGQDPTQDQGGSGGAGGGSSSDNGSISGNNNNNSQKQHHRNSTSAGVGGNQQAANSSSSSASSNSNSKVLTLAENIISAMHRKNNASWAPDLRLANSLDIEFLDHYHQRQRSLKGAQRWLTGSRSLSRDSDPTGYANGAAYGNMGASNAASNGFASNNIYSAAFAANGDPYWHQGALESDPMQPLSVVTDFQQTVPASSSSSSSGCGGGGGSGTSSNLVLGTQKRHSSSGFTTYHHNQQSAFLPYAQRPAAYPQQQQHCLPLELQNNMTETSSSGLGSIVSSLSPSTSSLHSPSSACTAPGFTGSNGTGWCVNGGREMGASGANRDDQSPCSCGRQSSGTPTSADFCEYFQASSKAEESFASLTLNDREQLELYEAAKVIQKAYRTYRGRKRQASELLIEPSRGFSSEQLGACDYHSSASSISVLVVEQQAQQQQQVDMIDSQQQQTVDQQLRCPASLLSQQHSAPSACYSTVAAASARAGQQQMLQATQLVKCNRDREMQAATIIQAYYRRYRQYAHFKRQQQCRQSHQQQRHQQLLQVVSGNGSAGARLLSTTSELRSPPDGRLVVDTIPVVIDKATTSHVDRKRFKTATLISTAATASCAGGGSNASECPQL